MARLDGYALNQEMADTLKAIASAQRNGSPAPLIAARVLSRLLLGSYIVQAGCGRFKLTSKGIHAALLGDVSRVQGG